MSKRTQESSQTSIQRSKLSTLVIAILCLGLGAACGTYEPNSDDNAPGFQPTNSMDSNRLTDEFNLELGEGES
jgi:hypothetical protein